MKIESKGSINERDVTPQWMGGKGNNLGAYTFRCNEFNREVIREMVKSDLLTDALADFANGQLNIRFGNKLSQERVERELPVWDKKAEKRDAWMAKHEQAAKEAAARVLPGFEADYVQAFVDWAEEDFAKRGAKKDTRDVLTDYDKIMAGLEIHWETFSQEKATAFCAKLGLAPELADQELAKVVAAIDAKYRRPVAVTAGDLF
ncbi:MAG TPA: hypothetical protein VM120_21105 [Bryobacteraceae bacterium]|nr:hypothetical protein [Bryobacteraceae bacterium]